MANKYVLRVLTAIAFLIIVQASAVDHGCRVSAQANSANTILDYYLKLPDKYFDGSSNERKARLAYVKISDLRNGYLKVVKPYQLQDVAKLSDKEDIFVTQSENKAARLTAQFEVVLFKHDAGGRNLIAVAYRLSGDCPACAIPKIDFWHDDNGQLTDVTQTILSQVNAQTAFAEYLRLGKPGDTNGLYETAELLKEDLVYELPRKGRKIKVVTDNESLGKRVELMNFRWTGKEFVSESVSRH